MKIKKLSPLLLKVAILGTVDFFCVIILLWLLSNLPVKADKLRNLQTLKRKATLVNLGSVEQEIMANKDKTDKLKAIFPDETGLLNFVQEIDKLKSEGVVRHFSFVSNKAIKDKTKYYGLPLAIEFRGSWQQIDLVLGKMQSFPFLIRPVNIEIREQEENLVNLKYGGVLYVDESFYPAPTSER